MKLLDKELKPLANNKPEDSARVNRDITLKAKELEGILTMRFNEPMPATIRAYIMDLLRLFPSSYNDLRTHCFYLNSLNNFESVYMFYIQRLRQKPKKKARRTPRREEVEPPKQKNIYHFKPSELKTDALRFQYKDDADKEGVTDRLIGVTEWNSANSGIVIVWEALDGVRYIADGHQRLGLAKRLNDDTIRLDGLLYREIDGFTPSKIRLISAYKNIAEQTGTALDTAKIIREIGGVKNYPKDLPKNGALYHYGIALSRLCEEAFNKVVNKFITIEQGAVIGNIIREDSTRQLATIDIISKEGIDTLEETELMARQVMATPFETYKQVTLFGIQDYVNSYAVTKIKLVNGALKQLRKTKSLMAHLNTNSKAIEDNGNILNKDNNNKLKSTAEATIEALKKAVFYQNELSDIANMLAEEVEHKQITLLNAISQFCDYCISEDILKTIL